MKSSIAGMGVDIVEIERFKNAMNRHPGLIHRVFTEKEKSYCLSRKKPSRHFAVRFANKEAVLKALKTGRRGIGWRDVEVTKTQSGSPKIELMNSAKDLINSEDIKEILVSLSFTHNSAVATAIAVRR